MTKLRELLLALAALAIMLAYLAFGIYFYMHASGQS